MRSTHSEAVTFNLQGGIGNQLFQYAAGQFLAKKLNVKLQLNTHGVSEERHGGYLIDRFIPNSNVHWINSPNLWEQSVRKRNMLLNSLKYNVFPYTKDKKHFFSSKVAGYDLNLLSCPTGSVVNGYFQSYRYADEINLLGGSKFLILDSPSVWYQETLQRIECIKPVIAHIRMGDYSTHRHDFGQLNMRYYLDSLRLLSTYKTNRNVWVFTNNANQCHSELENFGIILKEFNVEVISAPDDSHPVESLLLMKSGDALITANSTFSWWSAYLKNDNLRTVVPNKWFRGLQDPNLLLRDDWIKAESTWIL